MIFQIMTKNTIPNKSGMRPLIIPKKKSTSSAREVGGVTGGVILKY